MARLDRLAGGVTRGKRLALVGMIIIFAGTWASAASAQVDSEAARKDMRGLYASLAVLLPLSVDDASFRDPARQTEIRAALDELARRAQHVGDHVAGDDRRVQFLARSLSRETQEARLRFDEGRFDSAQFLVHRLTDFCVACHTRLPSSGDSPLASGFMGDAALAALPPPERASIQVATRRFDDALSTYEALFASPVVPPAALLAPLYEYLRVSIRVKNDLERPRPVLRKLAARPDLWSNLRGDVEDWLSALDRHVADSQKQPSIRSARTKLEEAQSRMRFPTDRRGLVQQLLASAELHRYLEEHPGQTGPDMAEAYYLLGLIEARTHFDSLVSESNFYLETAIRLAPTDEIGRQAFELLEEQTVLGWTGSGGDHMPEAIRRHLEELRALVEAGSEVGAKAD